ncbi:MAG: branched-chain amino acid ABC transporter permease [Rhizobiales bacterium]|nr:branched-chain amino acid ABC transporter permease [Hyphomicrobiales bacterium]
MLSDLVQYAASGVTVGAIYALIALGFTLIYNSTHVANFAQGDFAMLGAMTTVFVAAAGVPVVAAGILGILAAACAGLLLYRAAISFAKNSSVLGLIVLTIGAAIFLKGVAQIVFDKRFHSLPAWFGTEPIKVLDATIQPQSFVVLAGAAVIVFALVVFTKKTLIGKGILAISQNQLAATLVGINVTTIVTLAFVISAAIGGTAGILATPITLTSYDAGTLLSLKGFAAAMLGGMGSPMGAVIGGLVLGLVEAFGGGLISSAYKDAFAFLAILVVLALRPQGLVGSFVRERV